MFYQGKVLLWWQRELVLDPSPGRLHLQKSNRIHFFPTNFYLVKYYFFRFLAVTSAAQSARWLDNLCIKYINFFHFLSWAAYQKRCSLQWLSGFLKRSKDRWHEFVKSGWQGATRDFKTRRGLKYEGALHGFLKSPFLERSSDDPILNKEHKGSRLSCQPRLTGSPDSVANATMTTGSEPSRLVLAILYPLMYAKVGSTLYTLLILFLFLDRVSCIPAWPNFSQ